MVTMIRINFTQEEMINRLRELNYTIVAQNFKYDWVSDPFQPVMKISKKYYFAFTNLDLETVFFPIPGPRSSDKYPYRDTYHKYRLEEVFKREFKAFFESLWSEYTRGSYGYKPKGNLVDLTITDKCDCQDYKNGLVSNTCPTHNDNPLDIDKI